MANLTDIRSNWSTGASEGGVTVYATKENLPTTGLTSGDQAYVTNTSRLYISNGSGWYNVALINATPSLTIDPTGAIELSTAGATTTITLTATDSDNAVAGLTFSVDSDGSFGGLGTISQDSSVFTITPLSEDSATTTSSTLTFKASDGISFGSGTSAISLTFSIVNSNYTTLLLQADSDGTDNQVDASANAFAVTEYGNVTSTAFSPYHPGGYSNYITSAGNGYVEWTSPPTFSATAWCVETWFKPVGMPSVNVGNTGHWSLFGCWTANTNNKEFLLLGGADGKLRFYYSFDGSAAAYVDTATGVLQADTWIHLAISFDGTNYTVYADGVNVVRHASSTQIANKTSPLAFGKSIDGGGVTQTYVTGYYADGRVINGSTLESNNTFPVPTSRIDYSVANTQALMHHLPHKRQTVTYNGDATIIRSGPYDHLPYTKTIHSGSVYFDGTGDKMSLANNADFNLSSGSWTIECWIYLTGTYSKYHALFAKRVSGGGASTSIEGYIKITTGALSWYDGITERVSTGIIQPNTWSHCAWSHNGTNLKMFLNGENVYDAAISVTEIDYPLYIGGLNGLTSEDFQGYISDFRVVKGTQVYTSNFAAPTAPLTAITNTKLLTCTNKNDIWDAGSGSLLTKVGNTTASNTQRKFTGSSATYFDGSGDLLTFPASDKTSFTGDFTIEWWQYWVGTQASYGTIYDNNYNTTPNVTMQTLPGENKYHVYMNSSIRISESVAAASGQWYHYALVRNSGTVTLYRDGTSVGSVSLSATVGSASAVQGIGARAATGSVPITASYIQDFRITKGLARYTSNFTPPTSQFSG